MSMKRNTLRTLKLTPRPYVDAFVHLVAGGADSWRRLQTTDLYARYRPRTSQEVSILISRRLKTLVHRIEELPDKLLRVRAA